MVTLENWRERMSEDMRLRDYRPRTQQAYLAAARQFIEHVKREPETFADEEVRGYFLYLREQRRLAPSTIHIALHALRFFLRRLLQHVLPRGLHRVRAFGLLHPAHRHTLRRLQLLLAPPPVTEPPPAREPEPRRPRLRCPHCGDGSLRLLRRLSPAICVALALAADPATTHAARAPPSPSCPAPGAPPP